MKDLHIKGFAGNPCGNRPAAHRETDDPFRTAYRSAGTPLPLIHGNHQAHPQPCFHASSPAACHICGSLGDWDMPVPCSLIWNVKIRSQLFSGRLRAQPVKPGSKVDHISVRSASEAMETCIHLHAGHPVIVKGAGDETRPVHPELVVLRSLPRGNGLLHGLNQRHAPIPPHRSGC